MDERHSSFGIDISFLSTWQSTINYHEKFLRIQLQKEFLPFKVCQTMICENYPYHVSDLLNMQNDPVIKLDSYGKNQSKTFICQILYCGDGHAMKTVQFPDGRKEILVFFSCSCRNNGFKNCNCVKKGTVCLPFCFCRRSRSNI